MANLPGFIEEYTVTIPGVGMGLIAANVTLPHAPPAQGLIYQIEARVTVGPAAEIYATLDTPANGDTILTVEDSTTPGAPDPAPWDYSAPTVWYNRGAGNLRVRVLTDVVGPSTVEVKIKLGGNR
jgi:hypothetical protein